MLAQQPVVRRGPYSPVLKTIADRCQQYGWKRSVRDFFLSEELSCEQPDVRRVADLFGVNWLEWKRVVALSKRYRRRALYRAEVAPGWVEVERFFYADNSIEVLERARDGHERRRLVAAPSGDRCF